MVFFLILTTKLLFFFPPGNEGGHIRKTHKSDSFFNTPLFPFLHLHKNIRGTFLRGIGTRKNSGFLAESRLVYTELLENPRNIIIVPIR